MIAAFHRARTAEMTLLAIELETHQSIHDHNSGYKLVAFVREHRLNAQHIMPGEFPGERKLIGAAEILAQSLSIRIRREEMENGRSGAPRSLQQRQRA